MMINNVILTTIQKDNSKNFEQQYGYTSSITAKGTKTFLDGIKASISAEAKETSYSSSKVIETLDVKTTKSILLRRVIERCTNIKDFSCSNEGDLVKVDNVKLELFDEESLRQFLILRKDALKGFRVEGMEVNNLIGSMLQDYAYILKGTVINKEDDVNESSEIIIKIPLEIQNEFENKYNINDLIIGHVSLVGVYKGKISEDFITANTFTYLQEIGIQQNASSTTKVIKSATMDSAIKIKRLGNNAKCHFIDTIAVIQDVAFKVEDSIPKIHWWNKIGIWLRSWRRR